MEKLTDENKTQGDIQRPGPINLGSKSRPIEIQTSLDPPYRSYGLLHQATGVHVAVDKEEMLADFIHTGWVLKEYLLARQTRINGR